MNKRTAEQWQALFVAQQASGLNQAQFCKREGLCPKHFSLRRKQLLGADAIAATSSTAFIQAQPPSTTHQSQVSLYYQGIELRLPQADAQFIASVVKQLA